VAANATQANWFIRLEDVDWNIPSNGRNVTIITGVAINSAFRASRDNPQPLTPMEYYTLTAELHFTSWRFPPGHGVRVAITNSSPRMSWPSPPPSMSTYIRINDPETYIQLPVIPDTGIIPLAPAFTKIPYSPPKGVCPYGFDYPDRFQEVEVYHIPSESTEGEGKDEEKENRRTESTLRTVTEGGNTSASWYYLQNEPYAFNAFGNMVVAYLAQNMTLYDDAHPDRFYWTGYALQLIARNLSQVNASSTVDKSIAVQRVRFWATMFLQGGSMLEEALLSHPENGTMPLNSVLNAGWFELITILTVSSNATAFFCSIDRQLVVNGTQEYKRLSSTQEYPRMYQ